MLLGKGPNPSSKAVAAKHAAPSLAPAPRPGEAPEEAEAGRQGSLSKPVPPDPLQLLLERPQAARPGLMVSMHPRFTREGCDQAADQNVHRGLRCLCIALHAHMITVG